MENQKVTKIISDSKVARHLCKMGNHIVDIKKNKFKTDNSSVFVFEVTDKFKADLDSIVGEKAEA
jgi:non-homologous end joining protein Ku